MFTFPLKKAKRLPNSQSGFFLAEMIVALFIFSMVMTISIGSLILAVDANKKNQALQSVLNNLNMVLDTMTKNLAVGTLYNCGGDTATINRVTRDCAFSTTAGDSAVSFLFNEDLDGNGGVDDIIVYQLVTPTGSNGYIARTIYGGGGGTSEQIRMTAPDINITQLKFYVTGSILASSGDRAQPKVLIAVKGTVAGNPRTGPTSFAVQTLVTQRLPDFE